MNLGLPIVIAVVFCIAAVTVILVFSGGKKGGRKSATKRKFRPQDRNAILKDANRRLAGNSKDPNALLELGELYYGEQAWDKAMKTYEALADLCGSSPDLDEFEINFRYGMSALKLQRLDDAYKGFLIARTFKQDNFEVNFNLGYLEFQKRNYEKAVVLLKQAAAQNNESTLAQRYYGHTLFRLKSHKEALSALKRAIDLEPEDKESIFAVAETYYELGQAENAIKIFTHLRTDPGLGPNAALFAGTIHLNQHQYPKAIMDFEIGLKHQGIKIEILVELKYRLAAAYLKQQEISRAVSLLNEVQAVYPNYKDVVGQLERYQELNANRNLQTYLIAPASEYVTLCRRLVLTFFPQAKIKITDISVIRNEYADILADVETKKWQDIVMLRFIRTTGAVGELTLRDLYAKIKEMKAGKGYCITAGTFSDEARRFVEARLIDLVEKPGLVKTLNSIDNAAASGILVEV
jgi:tetratricopeptide (TPR) repeat protein